MREQHAFTFHPGTKTWPNISLEKRFVVLDGNKFDTKAKIDTVCADKIAQQWKVDQPWWKHRGYLGLTEIRLETLESDSV